MAPPASNANFPEPANVSRWEQPASLSFGSCGDNYGQRLRRCVVPPWTGKWRFRIASDDAPELRVAPTASRLDKARRACVSGWTNAQAFDTSPAQESEAMDLETGRRVETVAGRGGMSHRVAGKAEGLRRKALAMGQRWLAGVRRAGRPVGEEACLGVPCAVPRPAGAPPGRRRSAVGGSQGRWHRETRSTGENMGVRDFASEVGWLLPWGHMQGAATFAESLCPGGMS